MTTSRLSRNQQKKMIKQTVMIVLIAVVTLTGFIFYVVPEFVKFGSDFFETDGLTNATDQIPPQTPVLAAPVSATNSAILTVNGIGEAGAQAVLILNQDKLAQKQINDQGEFDFEIRLLEGENLIAVYSIDQVNNESVKTREYLVELDTKPPLLEIIQPSNGTTIELRKNQIINIVGKTEAKAKVFIDGRMIYPDVEGNFTTTYQLREGENKIPFKVVDKGGNVVEEELNIVFKF